MQVSHARRCTHRHHSAAADSAALCACLASSPPLCPSPSAVQAAARWSGTSSSSALRSNRPHRHPHTHPPHSQHRSAAATDTAQSGLSHLPSSSPAPHFSLSLRWCADSGYLSVAAATSLLKAASSIGIHLSPTQASSARPDQRASTLSPLTFFLCRCVCACGGAQLSAMVSADVPSSGLFELSSFVRQSSLMLAFLFDRQSVVERSALSERGVVAPIALLTAEDRERVEAELRQRFAEFDSNNDGTLDADEFAACLSDTSLCLSAQQIESLRKEVVQAAAAEGSADSGGAIEIHHFMTFAYGMMHITITSDTRTLTLCARRSPVYLCWVSCMWHGSQLCPSACSAKLLHLAREARIQQNYVNLTSLR